MPSEPSSPNSVLSDGYASLNELAAPSPVQNLSAEEGTLYKYKTLEDQSGGKAGHHPVEHVSHYDAHSRKDDNEVSGTVDEYPGLNELASPSPVANPLEEPEYRREFLESRRSRELARQHDREREGEGRQSGQVDESSSSETNTAVSRRERLSKFATQLFVVSYLILFSILGTLARLGLEALTTYPGSTLTISVLWANFGGSLIMGFLSEDRKLFMEGYGSKKEETDSEKRNDDGDNGVLEAGSSQSGIRDPVDPEVERAKARKAHAALKKTIPLYIGLTTGFCGSFTSFSSFMRDCFLALANEPLVVQSSSNSTNQVTSRNGGYSFMTLVAEIIVTVSLCLSALQVGAHLAIALERFTPAISVFLTRKIFDRSAVFIAFGVWLGSVFITIWPPDRFSGPAGQGDTSWTQETWRGQVTFALVFAPVGCLLRFYASMHMNGISPTFPLGTFIVNIFGTAVLGMSWDLQHAPLGTGGTIGRSIVGCQVLQGIQEGFCGCLTTVSTWVLELSGLRRKHAYFYGTMSIGVGLAFLVATMGSLAWSRGFSETACST
jgi:fluoride exporter